MPVTLTIKNVPDELAHKLRALATRHHRSLQGELMYSLEALVVAQFQERGQANRAFRSIATVGGQRSLAPRNTADTDDLLNQLDAIVTGSQWGGAPLLSRDQANDRSLTREFEYLAQEREAQYRR